MIDDRPRSEARPRPLVDAFSRPLRDLRLSVIDQCNLRCLYCMPEDHYTWLPKRDLLTVGEISRLVDIFVSLGVTKVRLTGGEPLIRRDLPDIVRAIAAKKVDDLAITTNGALLAERAAELKKAGLGRVTVSLDTLRPERFKALSQRGNHQAVLDGIESLRPAGFSGTKLDTVVIRGVNDDELVELIEFGRQVRAEVRFIEYMDVGGATRWSREQVYGKAEILETVARHYGAITALLRTDSAPATRFALPDGTTFGIISSTTEPFCSTCDRSRLTADGIWLGCLYALGGINLRDPLRTGATDADLAETIGDAWSKRADRGAEDRLAQQQQRGVFIPLERLQRDPHLEMHTRGG